MSELTSVTFTGHRADFFIFGYDETEELCQMIKAEMINQIRWLYEVKGVRVFYSGCSVGVDFWGAEAVLHLCENGYSDLKL